MFCKLVLRVIILREIFISNKCIVTTLLCNEIENKYHVMLICPIYAKPSMYKFVALLNAENIKEQQRLAAFTKFLFKEHNKQL